MKSLTPVSTGGHTYLWQTGRAGSTTVQFMPHTDRKDASYLTLFPGIAVMEGVGEGREGRGGRLHVGHIPHANLHSHPPLTGHWYIHTYIGVGAYNM